MDSNAKEEWLQTFQGATLVLEPEFGSPKVNHMFARSFDHMGRNAFFISVRGRIALGEEQVSQAEQYTYERMAEITRALDRKIETAKAVMLDADITMMATYNKPVKHRAIVVSPMQTQYIKLLKKADELLMYINTLMLHGEMTEREHSRRELEIKQHMRMIPNTIRKVTHGLRNRLSELQAKDAQVKEGPKPAAPASDTAVDSAAASPSEAPATAAPATSPVAAETKSSQAVAEAA